MHIRERHPPGRGDVVFGPAGRPHARRRVGREVDVSPPPDS